MTAAVAHRRDGLSVSAALQRATARAAPPQSIFAFVRVARPELSPMAMGPRAMVALSHAMEDECLARAAGGVPIGCFEREPFYRRSEARWRELAAAMDVTIVLADFAEARVRSGRVPSEVPYLAGSPMAREWALIAPSGCLLGRERPRTSPPARAPARAPARRAAAASRATDDRCFDAIWSAEPEVVFAAASVALELIEDGDVRQRGRTALGEPPAPSSPELRRAAQLANRMIGYLARP